MRQDTGSSTLSLPLQGIKETEVDHMSDVSPVVPKTPPRSGPAAWGDPTSKESPKALSERERMEKHSKKKSWSIRSKFTVRKLEVQEMI